MEKKRRKSVDCKITIRFIEGEKETLKEWEEHIKARHGVQVISESPILKDKVNNGYSVKHFEIFSGCSELCPSGTQSNNQ